MSLILYWLRRRDRSARALMSNTVLVANPTANQIVVSTNQIDFPPQKTSITTHIEHEPRRT